MPISLVAADAQPIFLLGLTQLFSAQSGIDLAAYCVTARKTREALHEHQPDILLIDFNLPDCKDMELIRELQQKGFPTKVIILTAALSDEQTIEALRLGVQGVILKNMPIPLLLQCIRKVAVGGQWLEKKSIGQAFEMMLRREAGARRVATILTERETEVMCLVAEGLSNRQIAEKLVLSQGTVKIHIHNIYGKLGVNNRVDLTLYAQKKGLV
ncbi:MAG: response regulator transcription factor [Desulfuromonadales bacterium]|jgi:DNA-binding NarL/FixJ family response regulator|nr:response regulator transcription factor [Desulfuromonadales bacterium]